MNTNNKKPFLASRTIHGIILTVAVAITVPAWKGYRETDSIEGAIDNALPALIAIIPGLYGAYGRAIATKPLVNLKTDNEFI